MKNKWPFLKAILGITTCFIISFSSKAQEESSISTFKVTTDLVSSYVWRGSLATGRPTPNFQPTLAFTKGKFEIGAWGSPDFVGSYKEIDPYFSFAARHIKLVVTDFNWNFDKTNYFNYNNYGLTAFDLSAGKKTFSIDNIGASVTKSLKINETFSLPLKATLVINPSPTYTRNDYVHLI